jgi:hypothetical protein
MGNLDLLDFPTDIIVEIFQFLETQDLAMISRSSKRTNNIANMDRIWRQLYL